MKIQAKKEKKIKDETPVYVKVQEVNNKDIVS